MYIKEQTCSQNRYIQEVKNYCERDRANEDRMVLELGKEMKNGGMKE